MNYLELMGSAPSSRAASVERERTVSKEPSALSKSEKAKVTKLFHRLETNDSGVVPLSTVTRLFHFRNNVLVKLVTTQYASKQDTVVGDKTDEDPNSKEVLGLEKFIELFDILSPKKDSSSKLKAIFNALKNKENGFITFQELASFFKLLLPSTLPQANIDAIVTNLLHQTDCSSEDDTSSLEHRRLTLEDFTKVVNTAEIQARLSVQV